MQRTKTSWSPGQPYPKNADRKTVAAIITHTHFPVSPRTIERWPLTVRKPNKKAILEVKTALEYAEKQLNKAYAYRQNGGDL